MSNGDSRKRILFFVTLAILFLALPGYSHGGQFKVIRIEDGDTLVVQGHDIFVKVKLIAVDAPETSRKKGDPGQPFSKEAKDHLAFITLNKTVEVKGYRLDWYNWVLAEVFLNGDSINLEMVKAGLAEISEYRLPEDFNIISYFKAQGNAKTANLGMWIQGSKYISPSDWRKGKR